MRLKWLRFGLGMLLAVLLTGNLAAQVAGRGSLSGLVTDPEGAVVPSATVVLTNTATGVTIRGKTSAAGLYSFVSLIPGVYRLEATQSGFQTTVQEQITVAVDQAETLNVTLRIGIQSQSVKVSAANDITAATSSTTGQLISSEVINRIPLVQRDVFQLAMLSPGVIPQDGNVTSIDSGRNQVSNFTINGAQQGTIYYILDGSPLTIGENNQGVVIPALEPPLDSVEEFRMELNATPASVQTGAAGVISLVSKSGTNAFHGDGFVWIRPDGLNANTYFNNLNGVPIPDFHRYQWGGSIGGPLKKNKFFSSVTMKAPGNRPQPNSPRPYQPQRRKMATSLEMRALLCITRLTLGRIAHPVRLAPVRKPSPGINFRRQDRVRLTRSRRTIFSTGLHLRARAQEFTMRSTFSQPDRIRKPISGSMCASMIA